MTGQSVMDCAVVGAGPAGLPVSAALAVRGVDHVVLERGRVGETWRTQRWDSFRLNTPGCAEDINSVVWCTGFTGDFSWLSPELVGAGVQPRRDGVSGPIPGLWYGGFRWLTRRRSAVFFGFPDDAATIADAVNAHLDGVGAS